MYGSMINLRVSLQKAAAIIPLAKVMTIAVRYSAVRRQGHIDPECVNSSNVVNVVLHDLRIYN